jgi:uncharacterized repeat protein (TIGR03943 family)
MKQLAYRLLAPMTLLEWGVILVYFYGSGRLASFLHPDFRPLVLVTGVLLILSAGCVLFTRENDWANGHDCALTDCDHVRATLTVGGVLAFLVLLLPIALAAETSPDSYGITLMRNRGVVAWEKENSASENGSTTPANASHPNPNQATIAVAASPAASLSDTSRTPERVPKAEPEFIEVGDLLLAAQDPSAIERWNHRRVRLEGQLCTSSANGFELVRMLILCCAADAQPLAVRIETNGEKNFSEMEWTSVVGTVSFVKKGNTDAPVIAAEKMTRIPAPSEPFVYHGASMPVQHRGAPMKFKLPTP